MQLTPFLKRLSNASLFHTQNKGIKECNKKSIQLNRIKIVAISYSEQRD